MKPSLSERLAKKERQRVARNKRRKKQRAELKANGGKTKWTPEQIKKNVWLDHWKIKPGEIKNPDGINRHPLSEAYKDNLDAPLPEALRIFFGLHKGATIAEGIARRQSIDALTAAPKDAVRSAQEVGDRAEGKSVTRLSGPAGEGLFPPTLNVTFVRKRSE